jgi:hypothetical protein
MEALNVLEIKIIPAYRAWIRVNLLSRDLLGKLSQKRYTFDYNV